MSGNAALLLPGLEEAVGGDVAVTGTVRKARASRGDFQVVEVEVERAGRIVVETWVGEFGPVAPGQRVRGVGRYEKHPQYGEQLRAALVVVDAPTERGAIVEYLGACIEGVGPTLARSLVDHFGDAVLDVLDTHPERAEEVPGMGPERAAAVARGWRHAQATNRVMIFLGAHGASSALAGKIVRFYQAKGVDPLAVVSQEPYRLALEVYGVGFATADALAKDIGIAADSPQRAEAGALHVLHDIGSRGHTYVDMDELVSRTASLLGRQTPEGRTSIRGAVEELGRAKRVVVEPHDGAEETLFGPERVQRSAVYEPRIYEAEWVVAARIAALSSSLGRGRGDRGERLVGLAEAACDAFEVEAKIQLAPEQRAAVTAVAAHPVVVITGSPGTGKSSIVRAVLMFCAKAGFRVKLAAPTGRAAKRLQDLGGDPAQTLHRLLGMPPGQPPEYHAKRPLDTDVLIVDEASMADLSLTRALLEATADGTRVVFVGDRDQLPSVQPGAVLRDLIASGAVPVIRLERIFRQGAGSTISAAAREIMRGRVPESDEGKDGEFYTIEAASPVAAVALIEKLVAERIPESFGIAAKDVAVLVPQHKGPGGTLELNTRLQALLNPNGRELRRKGRVFRAGDRVLQLKNDYEREVFNGDMGTIVEVRPRDAVLVVDFDGRHVTLDDEAMEDLTLAYAMSVHKVQGDQRPAVVLYLGEHHAHMLGRNLTYTAVTRGQRLVVVVASRRALGMAVREQRRDVRRTRLAERLRAMVGRGDGKGETG